MSISIERLLKGRTLGNFPFLSFMITISFSTLFNPSGDIITYSYSSHDIHPYISNRLSIQITGFITIGFCSLIHMMLLQNINW